MSTTTAHPTIGFIGLGDQGLPMATAIAEAGYPLYKAVAWSRMDVDVRRGDVNDASAVAGTLE